MDDRGGFIRLPRWIFDSWLFQDPVTFTWWVDIVQLAQWEDKEWLVDGKVLTIKRGSVVASTKFLMKRWKVGSNNTVIRFLKLLEDNGMITRSVLGSKTAVITVANYEQYIGVKSLQELHTTLHTLKGMSNADKHKDSDETEEEYCTPPCTPPCTQNKEIKEIKKLKGEAKASMFHGVAEERAVCTETEHLGIDLERFASFFNREIETAGALIKPIKGIRVGTRRRTAVLARLRESGKDGLREAVEKAARSDFLNGRNGRGWLATFDWIFRPENFQKVLEGNYDNGDKNDIRQKSNGNTDGNNGNNKGVGGRLSYEDVCKAVIVGNSLDE